MSKISLEQEDSCLRDSTATKHGYRRNIFSKRAWRILSNVTIEPMVSLYTLAHIATGLTTQNLNLDKACNVNLKMDKSICDAIKHRNISGYNISQEVEVQKLIALAYTWKFVIQSTFSVIILAFIGSWSDRNGRRKIVVLGPLFGEMCTVLGLILCTFFFYELPMEFNIVSETVSYAFTGGMNVFLVGIFTIICAKTTLEERTLRLGVVHVMFHMGLTVSLAVSGFLISRLGFYGVYGVVLILHALSAIYGTIIIKEEKQPRSLTKEVGFFRDFFNLESLKSTFEIVFKNEDKLKRKKIILIMLIAMLVAGPLHGEIGVIYMYTRYKFHWNEIDYGVFFAFATVVHLTGSAVGLLIFSKLLKMDDALMGACASISKIMGALAFAFAPTGTMFYIATGVDILSSLAFISMRAIVSKQTATNELGKMNSIFALAEAFVPLAYGPLYSVTYRWTIEIFPGMFYVISSILTIPVFVIFLWLYKNRTQQLEESSEKLKRIQKPLLK